MTTNSLSPRRTELHPSDPAEWGLNRMGREFDHLLGEFFGPMLPPRLFRFPEQWGADPFLPRCDVEDGDTAFVLRAEVPGYAREDLHVDLSGDTLTLRGERTEQAERGDTRYVCRESHRGTFERTFRLPGEIDADRVEAKLKDGILTLTLPKLHAAEHRHIEVSEG